MNDQSTNFQDILEIIYRRKWVILIPLLLGALGSVYISMGVKPYYISSTLILVEHQKVPESYVTPTDTTPVATRLSTITQQIMSRTNLEKIIKEFNLYRGNEGDDLVWGMSRIKKYLGIDGGGKASMEDAVEKMRDSIEVEVIGKTKRGGGDAFTISYQGADPTKTMDITNDLASMFIEENLKIREMNAEGTSVFLESELGKSREELEVKEDAIRKFKETNRGALPDQLDSNLRTLDRLQLELQSMRNDLRSAKDRKAALEDAIYNSGSENNEAVLLGPEVSLSANPVKELERLRSLLDQLLSTYTENYPDVQVVRSNIKQLEDKIAKTTEQESSGKNEDAKKGEIVKKAPSKKVIYSKRNMEILSIKSQINFYENRNSQLVKQIKRYEKRVEAVPGNEQKLADLKRGYSIMLRNYQSLKEKILDARLAENMEKKQKGERFRVIDPANHPEKPIYFSKYKIIVAGFLGGLGVGAGLAYLLEFLNPAFRKPEDFLGVIDPPVLATIPFYSSEPDVKKSAVNVS